MRALLSAGRSVGLALGAAFLAANIAQAQERGVVFANVSGGQDRSASIGLGLALPGSRLGEGWAVRGSASAGDYDYESGATTIRGKYRGGELLIVRQSSGPKGYFNFGAGPRYVDTKLSPVDPGNRRRGGHWDAGLVIDGARTYGPWRAMGYASYGLDMHDYYGRFDVTRRIGESPLRLGVEVGAEGDRDYERQRIGVVAAIAPSRGWELRLAVGGRNGGSASGGYGALSAVRTF